VNRWVVWFAGLVIGAIVAQLIVPVQPWSMMLSALWGGVWYFVVGHPWQKRKRKRKLDEMSILEIFWLGTKQQVSNLFLGWRLQRMSQSERIEFLRETLQDVIDTYPQPYPDQIIRALHKGRQGLKEVEGDQ
jgi:hypothetical protein